MKIDQLNHVALHVADVTVSTAFYRDVLGLAPLARPDFGFPGAWFRIGVDQELHLISGRDPEIVGGNRSTHYAMRVTDADAAAARLREHGVDFSGPKARPDGAKQIFFKDPDGHTVELTWFS